MKLQTAKPYLPVACFGVGVFLILGLSFGWSVGHYYLSLENFPNQFVPAVAGLGGSFEVSPEVEAVWIDGQPARLENGRVWVENLDPGWYEVTVRLGGRIENRGKALYVMPFREDNFLWAVVSDIHVPRFGKVIPEIVENGLRLVNGLGPGFVFLAGDAVDFGLDEEWKTFMEVAKAVEVPFFKLPGNHETYIDPYLKRWNSMFGPTNYSFKIGDVLFVGACPIGPYRAWGGFNDEELKWLENRLAQPAQLKFLIEHYPIAYGQTTIYSGIPYINRGKYNSCIVWNHEKTMELLERENVVNVFGHWHVFDEPFEYKGLTFYHNPSLSPNSKGGIIQWALGGGMFAAGHSFYLFRIENSRIAYAKPIDIWKLKIEGEKGEATENIQVTNEHPYPVPLNLRVELGPGSYSSSMGEILQDSTGCWVRFEVPENRTVVVQVQRL